MGVVRCGGVGGCGCVVECMGVWLSVRCGGECGSDVVWVSWWLRMKGDVYVLVCVCGCG